MGYADGAGLLDLRMEVEDLIDVPRIDVEAAGDDHVLLPVDDVEVTVLVHRGDIARVAPAVAERFGRLVRPVLVAQHDLGPLDDQLAPFADGHVRHLVLEIHNPAQGVGDRDADAPHLSGPAGKGVDVGHRRRLRHPEALDDDRPRRLLEVMDYLDGQRRASGEGALDAAHVRLLQIRMVQHPDVHGGDQRCKGGTVQADRLQ